PARTASAGLRQPSLSPSRCRGRGGTREKPDQIEGAGQSRASDRGHQASVWLRQGALPRAQKEHSSPARDLRARQSVYGAPASIVLRGVIGLTCLATSGCPRRRRYTNNDTTTPILSLAAAISVADIYSQLLVQTFPNEAEL